MTATIAEAAPGRSTARARRPRAALAAVLGALAVAGVAELLLQRTFYRVGIFIPKHGPFWAVYRTGTMLGSYAFNLASILAVAAVAIASWRLALRGRRATAASLGALAALALAAPMAGSGPALPTLYRAVFVVAIAAAASPALRAGPPARRAVTAGVVAAYACSAYVGLANGVMALGGAAGAPPGGTLALAAGEAIVLVLGPAFLLAWRRDAPGTALRRPLAWAAVPAGLLLAALIAQPRYAGILVIWTVGLGFVLPALLYVLSFWAFTGAALGRLGRPRDRIRGIAAVLLLVAGYVPQSTYEFLVAAAAIALWADPALAARDEPALRPLTPA